MRLLSDSWLVFRRSLGLTVRQPAWLVAGVVQPFVYLLLFGPLLNSLSGVPGLPARRRVQRVRPGPARDDRPVRLDLRRLRVHRRDAPRRRRADAGHADEPDGGVLGRTMRDICVFGVPGPDPRRARDPVRPDDRPARGGAGVRPARAHRARAGADLLRDGARHRLGGRPRAADPGHCAAAAPAVGRDAADVARARTGCGRSRRSTRCTTRRSRSARCSTRTSRHPTSSPGS